MNGYGKRYWQDGTLWYESQFEGMQYAGWGKEYYENSNIKFEGIIQKGIYFFYGARRYVVGKLYYEDGSLQYEGTFTGLKSSEFNKGIEYLPDGRKVLRY
jgi:antitoxin component YwqK of YwqJK toxin-antitoxin module